MIKFENTDVGVGRT